MSADSTTFSADLALDRAYFTTACRAMDAAVRAARYNATARDRGTFDPLYESRLRRNFNEYRREVLRMNRVSSDAATLDAVDRLIDCGDIEGVQNIADKWLGLMQPNVRAVVKADQAVRESHGMYPVLIKDRAIAASIAVHHGATLYQIATCTGHSFSTVNKWLSNDK